VLDRAIRSFAVAACVFVALGFVLFAVDALSNASTRTVNALVADSAARTQIRDHGHSTFRKFVDHTDDVLLAPFAVANDSSNQWAVRGIPTVLALLAYGLGLLFLANWIRGGSV